MIGMIYRVLGASGDTPDAIFSIKNNSNTLSYQIDREAFPPAFNGKFTTTGIGASFTPNSFPNNGPSLYILTLDRAANLVTIHIDGTFRGSTPYVSSIDPVNDIHMFCNRGDSRRPQGYMGEMFATEDVSTATRQRYEGNFLHAFDLQSQLPGDHPYRDSAP
jgi:hypothetical protein